MYVHIPCISTQLLMTSKAVFESGTKGTSPKSRFLNFHKAGIFHLLFQMPTLRVGELHLQEHFRYLLNGYCSLKTTASLPC